MPYALSGRMEAVDGVLSLAIPEHEDFVCESVTGIYSFIVHSYMRALVCLLVVWTKGSINFITDILHKRVNWTHPPVRRRPHPMYEIDMFENSMSALACCCALRYRDQLRGSIADFKCWILPYLPLFSSRLTCVYIASWCIQSVFIFLLRGWPLS